MQSRMSSEAGKPITDLAIRPHAANTRCNGDVLLAAPFTMLLSETSNNASNISSNMVGCSTCNSFDFFAKFLGATPSERAPMGGSSGLVTCFSGPFEPLDKAQAENVTVKITLSVVRIRPCRESGVRARQMFRRHPGAQPSHSTYFDHARSRCITLMFDHEHDFDVGLRPSIPSDWAP
jgi:hypothetical protein